MTGRRSCRLSPGACASPGTRRSHSRSIRRRSLQKEEKELWAAVRKAEAALKTAANGIADTLFAAFVPMIPSVNEFFDKVLVM